MKRFISQFCMILLTAGLMSGCSSSNRTQEHALERLEEYAQAIDYSYKEPAVIYALLCSDFKSKMTEEEFIGCWQKERTYPYITPLYISQPVVTMAEDGLSGSAVYLQAARIIGMTYEVNFLYENGDYFIQDWDEFLDGSYLEKFENTPYSLEWYYDTEKMER